MFPVPGTEGPVQGGHWKDSQMCVFPENLGFQEGFEIGKDTVASLGPLPVQSSLSPLPRAWLPVAVGEMGQVAQASAEVGAMGVNASVAHRHCGRLGASSPHLALLSRPVPRMTGLLLRPLWAAGPHLTLSECLQLWGNVGVEARDQPCQIGGLV